MEKIRLGIIGCGGIADRRTIPETLKVAADNTKIMSIMNRTTERAREVAQKYDIPHWCDSVQELLAQDIDAVYIATPVQFHCQNVIEAAQAGKHILCEKPMALSMAEAKEMTVVVKKACVQFMTAFCMRFNPYNIKARELVQSGALGQIVSCRAQLTCWYPPIPGAWRQDKDRSGGGSYIDMGTHCMDLLEWILGVEVAEVTVCQNQIIQYYQTPQRYQVQVEDTSIVVARFNNEAYGIIENYFNIPDAVSQNRLEIYGTKGSIICNGTLGQNSSGKMIVTIQDQCDYNAQQNATTVAATVIENLDSGGIYGEMVSAFAKKCIRNNSMPPIISWSGIHSVAVTETVYMACEKNRTMEIINLHPWFGLGSY